MTIRPAHVVAIAALAATATLPACTWVKPTVSAENVRVAYDGNVSGCRDAGAISVSVTDKIAFYHRSGTIKAKDEPNGRAQDFEAYVCGGVRVKQRDDGVRAKDEAQTFPIKDH
jgi:hypothetical protein